MFTIQLDRNGKRFLPIGKAVNPERLTPSTFESNGCYALPFLLLIVGEMKWACLFEIQNRTLR